MAEYLVAHSVTLSAAHSKSSMSNRFRLDISMHRMNGLDAARQLRKSHLDCNLIFLTMNEDAVLAAEAFRIGALGYFLKTSATTELFQAIEQVLAQRLRCAGTRLPAM